MLDRYPLMQEAFFYVIFKKEAKYVKQYNNYSRSAPPKVR